MNKKTDTLSIITLIIAAGLFIAQCWWLYGSTARDDAFLSYWPAHTLATSGELLNYNGERVEQSSTLLHTIWLALCDTLIPVLKIPFLAWLSSLLAALFTLCVTSRLLHSARATPVGVLLLSTLPGFLYWANSGMETLLVTLLLTAILLLLQVENNTSRYSQVKIGTHFLIVVTCLAVIARPELFLVLLTFGILYGSLLILTRSLLPVDKKLLSHFFTAIIISTVAVTTFRFFYFDALFPQPVFAKSSGINAAGILKGIIYITQADGSLLARLLLGSGLFTLLAGIVLDSHPHRRMLLCTGSLLIAQLAFIVTTGGDWMEAGRFLVPVMPCVLVALFVFIAPWRTGPSILALILCMAGVYESVQFVRTESSGFARWERDEFQQHYLGSQPVDERFSAAEHYTKDALRDIPQLEALIELGKVLEKTATTPTAPEKKPRLEIMSIQMGFIPYHLAQTLPQKFHFLDLRGLSTRQMTDCSLIRDFPNTDTGIKISYDDFFNLLPQLHTQCGINKPDVIYDMGWKMRKDVLLKNGYRFVYLEPRMVQGSFAQRGIGSDLFIAVRNELAEAANLQTVQNNEPLRKITQIQKRNLPNIVLLLGDDISYDSYGFTGNPAAKTPTLDQLAQQGTVFTTAHTPSAFCRPTLASILTGKWPHQSRIHANNGVVALPPGYPTLAKKMQDNGYATFAGGKFWEDEPELRGFDSFDTDRNTFARQNQDALWNFLDQHGGKNPFFIWWAPMLPHTPHNPSRHYLDRIDPATIPVPAELSAAQQNEYRERQHQFLAMTLWMDDEIKKLYTKLQDQQLLDNTLIVYLGDNGFSHRAVSKSSPYELGLRTPMIFHWPKHLPSRQIGEQTSSIHLYATLLDFAGITSDAELPGKTLRPVLENQQQPVSETLFGASYQAVTIKTDPEPRPERDIFALSVRDGDWKYVLYVRDVREKDNADLTIKSGMQPFPERNAGDEELFYLPEDAIEQHNLIDLNRLIAKNRLIDKNRLTDQNSLATSTEQQERIQGYRKAVMHWWETTGGKPLDSLRDCPASPSALCEKIQSLQQQ